MDIEKREEKTSELDIPTLKEAFASINALNFVLELNGSLGSGIDKKLLIQSQVNLIFESVEDIYPNLDQLVVDGFVISHPEYEHNKEHKILSLEDLATDLSDRGKELGLLEEISPGYSSDGLSATFGT